jgi:hypothetical protein
MIIEAVIASESFRTDENQEREDMRFLMTGKSS